MSSAAACSATARARSTRGRRASTSSRTDQAALAALDSLYGETSRYRELVEILERRRDLAEDDAKRREFSARRAEVLWKRLSQVDEAIDAYQGLVSEFGPSTDRCSRSKSLFGTAERWLELADTYEQHLDIVSSDVERLDLLAKLGDIKRVHVKDVPGALEVYRRALTLDAQHAPSRAALETLLDAIEPNSRREAAQVLRPLYEADQQHEKLLRVIEIEIETTDDALEKLAGLEAALRVAEGPLGDPRRASGTSERAVRTALGHTDVTPWLTHLERLANATDRTAEYVKLLCDIVDGIFDGEVQLSITLRIAELARDKLADRDLAKSYYKKGARASSGRSPRADRARVLVRRVGRRSEPARGARASR